MQEKLFLSLSGFANADRIRSSTFEDLSASIKERSV